MTTSTPIRNLRLPARSCCPRGADGIGRIFGRCGLGRCGSPSRRRLPSGDAETGNAETGAGSSRGTGAGSGRTTIGPASGWASGISTVSSAAGGRNPYVVDRLLGVGPRLPLAGPRVSGPGPPRRSGAGPRVAGAGPRVSGAGPRTSGAGARVSVVGAPRDGYVVDLASAGWTPTDPYVAGRGAKRCGASAGPRGDPYVVGRGAGTGRRGTSRGAAAGLARYAAGSNRSGSPPGTGIGY